MKLYEWPNANQTTNYACLKADNDLLLPICINLNKMTILAKYWANNEPRRKKAHYNEPSSSIMSLAQDNAKK